MSLNAQGQTKSNVDQPEPPQPEATPSSVADAESEAQAGFPSTEEANQIVRTNTLWAAGAGAIPLPIVDFAAITAINLKMMNELANHYGVEFRTGLAKSALVALISGAGVPWLAYGPIAHGLKFLPGVGQFAGMIAGPVLAGAVTYAVGRVFEMHFASGGTLLDFDPEMFRDYFKSQLERGRKVAKEEEVKADETAAQPADA